MEQAQEITGQILTLELPPTRITQFRIGRMHNLGNYEHIKYEVTVEVAPGDDVGRRLTTIETILNDLQADLPHSEWDINRAKELLARPEGELDEYELKRIPRAKQQLAENEAAQKRRELARAALSTLNYESEHKDAKKDWDDDDYDGDADCDDDDDMGGGF